MGHMPADVPTAEAIQAALATVNDPEIRRPITELGMVRSAEAGPDGRVRVELLLTVAGCPMRDRIREDVTAAVSQVPGVTGVELEFGVMTPQQRQELQQRCVAPPPPSRSSRSPNLVPGPGCLRSPPVRVASASRA